MDFKADLVRDEVTHLLGLSLFVSVLVDLFVRDIAVLTSLGGA